MMKDLKDYTEEELLVLYREAHDLKVIGELFKRHQHIVLGICLKYLKDMSSAEDTLMEIFEELIIALRTAEVRSFKPWLGTVTRNHLHRKYKRESKVRTLSFEDNAHEVEEPFMELGEDGAPIHESAHIEQMEGHLKTAMGRLKKEQQECVQLFYIENRSYADTCKQTGYSFKEVKSYIQNGKRNLRNILDGLTQKDI